jgi:hypothetical protein
MRECYVADFSEISPVLYAQREPDLFVRRAGATLLQLQHFVE